MLHPRRVAALAFVLALLPPSLRAQAPGTARGRVVDERSGAPLANAGVQIVGMTLGAMTGDDGTFSIAGVRPGTVTIHVRRIGYAPRTLTGLMLDDGGTLDLEIALVAATVELATRRIVAAARGSVNESLQQQREATGVTSSITAEQISRSPDSDAAQAVQRVSGVTVQDGRYVSVRGLNERYTVTSLNGARIPSPEPERRVVPLDVFPSGLLQSVTTSKTFTPDQPGDFSGALVDLRTREFPSARQVSYSISAGYNDRATGRSLAGAPREGLEWLGFGGAARHVPAVVKRAGDLSGSYSPQEYNTFAGAFRNAWSVRDRTGMPNLSTSVTVGGNDPVLGRRLGYTGSFTYSYATEVRDDEVRAFPVPTADGGTGEVDRFAGSSGRESVLWGGLLNLSTMVGSTNRLTLNNTYTRSAENEARSESGLDENSGLHFDIERLRFVERSVWSSQLAGEHETSARTRLRWSVTGSGVTRREPDRSEVVYARDSAGATPFLFGATEGAVRTFGDLAEYNVGTTADYTVGFGSLDLPHLLKVGGVVRYTMRDAHNSSYSLQASIPREERELAPEVIFGGRYGGGDVLRVVALSQGGSYSALDLIGAGYAMAEYQLGERYRLIGGARLESQTLEVTAAPLFGRRVSVRPGYLDVLPALALNVQLGQTQTIRLSASQTLARPEYREIVPIASRDVIGGEQFRGNEGLRRTLVQNADLRWEWYPQDGEVVSVAFYAKRFVDPIERVYRGTSGTRVTTFENAAQANAQGAELELRKTLAFLAEPLRTLTVFSNVTLMRSAIDLRNVGAGSVADDRPMVGQAPYVVNGGLTHASDGGRVSATALYNVTGRRIYAASLLPLPNVYEEPRHVVDLSLRFPVLGLLTGRVDARNVLDAPYEVRQGTVTRERYRSGRVLQFGLSWSP